MVNVEDTSLPLSSGPITESFSLDDTPILWCQRFFRNENKTFIRPDFVGNSTFLCAGEFKKKNRHRLTTASCLC